MADRYDSFAALAAREIEGVDYRICVTERASPIAIVAPHGGLIEPGTSQIAAAIAADRLSLYCFESLNRANSARLHITSSRFDEPRALALIAASDVVLTIHGRKNGDDNAAIWVGGLHEALRDEIALALAQSGFAAKAVGEGHPLSGRDPANICNRGRIGAGVQMELPRALRIRVANDSARRQVFAEAVRQALDRMSV